MGKLTGKIALITGGTSGMGAATAKLFQAEGATVIATGASLAGVEAARMKMPSVEFLQSDASDATASKTLIDHIVANHGHLDTLFLNAGIARLIPLEQVDEAISMRSSIRICAVHISF